jgi:acyl-CoA synthetase (AMP-forming)/AMP-acid ligase II
MSSPIRSHLTVLENSAATYGSLPAFRLPTLESTGAVRDWQTVTYRQFFADVERVARYWHHRLVATGLPHRSVVGVWLVTQLRTISKPIIKHWPYRLSGMTYDDVLHTYAIARAGFIPQMFSLRLPNPDVIYALMRQANASALIYDTSNASSMASAPVPTFPAVASSAIPTSTDELPSITANLTGTDTWCIFHTSGSTSGMPKVIRCSYNWLDKIITKANFLCRRRNSARQDVTTWVGSMSHIAQTFS